MGLSFFTGNLRYNAMVYLYKTLVYEWGAENAVEMY